MFFRKFDFENFLCTLLLPKAHQNASFVIRAFNIEVAKVQDSVSDANIGNARLVFWENAVDQLYTENVPAHPVLQELNKVIRENLTTLVKERRQYQSYDILSVHNKASHLTFFSPTNKVQDMSAFKANKIV